MGRPKHIFFDLDHTLWDYETNSIATIKELLLGGQSLMGRTVTFEEFYPIYYAHNHDLWTAYRRNEIDNLTLRYQRWRMAFEDQGIAEAAWMYKMSEDFIDQCPRKPGLMPNAIATLDALAAAYPLHIITNGFAPVQAEKLGHSGLGRYFDVVMTPDAAGVKKPDTAIFAAALEAAGCAPEESVHIGDSYVEDLHGGTAAGMQVIYYNPRRRENPDGYREVGDLWEIVATVEDCK